eukprot:s8400_g1.t1
MAHPFGAAAISAGDMGPWPQNEPGPVIPSPQYFPQGPPGYASASSSAGVPAGGQEPAQARPQASRGADTGSIAKGQGSPPAASLPLPSFR